MSRYGVGWLAIIAFVLLLVGWVAGAAVFVRPDRFGLFAGLSLIFWSAVMGILAIFPRCSTCRMSVFTGKTGFVRMGRPWPSRQCSGCGRRLDAKGS